MAQTREDFERICESMVMRRAIYPKFISKKLVVFVPLGCLEVVDERLEDRKEGHEND